MSEHRFTLNSEVVKGEDFNVESEPRYDSYCAEESSMFEIEMRNEQEDKLDQQNSGLLLSFTSRYLGGQIRSGVGACTGNCVPKGLVAEWQLDPVAARWIR